MQQIDAQAAMLYCEKHPSEEEDIYCRRCKIPACTTCLREDHSDHEFDTIAKLSRKLTNNRDTFMKDLTAKYERKEKPKSRKIREVKCRNTNVRSNNVNALEKRREQLHSIVDELIDKQVNKCQTHNDQFGNDVDRLERKHNESDGKIKRMLTTFENTTMVGLDIIEYYEKLSSLVEEEEAALDVEKHCDRLVYREGEVDQGGLQRMVGEVEEAERIPGSPEQVSAFRYKESAVCDIRPVSHDDAWITFPDGKFTLLKNDGHLQDSVPIPTGNISFFVTDDNSFISADYHKQVVVRIDHAGRTTNIMTTSPLRPLSVGPALNGNILVTLVDEVSDTRTAESQCQVQMVTSAGEVLHTYEFGEDGSSPAFTRPICPTQNYNSNVCVINILEIAPKKYIGSECVFHEDGGMKFVYSSNGKEFYPQDICCDSLCNIICTSNKPNNFSVHIINSEGTFMKHLFTNDTCLPRPSTVALYKDVLWVGSRTGDVRVYRYKQ